MSVYMDAFGSSNTYVNNKLVQGKEFDANYNGKELNMLFADTNGKRTYVRLKNRELENLITNAYQPHSLTIEKRLKNDFLKTKTKTKTKKKTKTKTKTRKKKRKKNKK